MRHFADILRRLLESWFWPEDYIRDDALELISDWQPSVNDNWLALLKFEDEAEGLP